MYPLDWYYTLPNIFVRILLSTVVLLHPAVVQVEHQDILCPGSHQLVHNRGNPVLLNHSANGHPILVVQGTDGWCPPSGRDQGGRCQFAPEDVVLAEDVFARGDDTCYPGRNHVDEGFEIRVFLCAGFDQDSFSMEDCPDGVQTSSSHRISGLCQ